SFLINKPPANRLFIPETTPAAGGGGGGGVASTPKTSYSGSETSKLRHLWETKEAEVAGEIGKVGGIVEGIQTELGSTQQELEETRTTLESTRTELGSTRTTLESTQTELGSTRTTLEGIQTELGSTRTTLESTQTELGSTQTTLESIQAELGSTRTTLGETQTELGITRTTLGETQEELLQKKGALQQAETALQQANEKAYKGYLVTGTGAALNIYIHTLESSLTITESSEAIIGMYFLKAPALTLNLSSFTKLITLDAGLWDNVSLATVKTLSHPDTGKLRTFVAPDSLETISTDYQFGYTSSANSTKFDSFTARELKSITGKLVFSAANIITLNLPALTTITAIGDSGVFKNATINTLNLPSLTDIGYKDSTTTITSNYTFYSLNTNGNPLSLPKLVSIIGNYTFYNATTGAIDLPSLISITGNVTFYYLNSSTLTLRTNLKISKTSSSSSIDNFSDCCYGFRGNTFLNLLYSTEEGIPGGTPMTGVTLNLDEEPTSPDAAVAGKWKMNASYSLFLTKLKTITLKPAEGMPNPPSNFTITTGITSWDSLTLGTPDSSGVYTWTKP
ncbi:MAG: leucine-rich repeat protein, partial [Holosporales bacterium]|nr:leucine-rich repeat protein [Holosporales bacterium]